jgi:hypothetical protein
MTTPSSDPKKERISAARAQKLLATVDEDRIRNIRKAKVEQYARDMLAGNWHLHAPILINTLGKMVDGNHRMRALVQAASQGAPPYPAQPGIEVEFLVIYDFPATMEAEDTIDTGMARKYSDVLAIRGFRNSVLVSSLARRLFSWDQGIFFAGGGRVGRTKYASFSELDKFMEKHEDELVAAASFSASYHREAHMSPTTLALAQILLFRKDPDLAGEFFSMLISNTAPAGHPVWRLRGRLEKMDLYQAKTRNGYMAQAQRLALTIIAWNHVRGGTTPESLNLPKGGLTNKNFPDPH